MLLTSASLIANESRADSDDTESERTAIRTVLSETAPAAGDTATAARTVEARLGSPFHYRIADLHKTLTPGRVSVLGLPDWLQFDASSGVVSGRPQGRDFGPPTTFTVRTDDDTTGGHIFHVSVRVVPDPVEITGTSPSSLNWGRLGTGERVYADAAAVFTRVPGELRMLKYLLTENSQQFDSAASAIEFDLDRPARILVAYDARTRELPAWLDGWLETDLTIEAGGLVKQVWSRDFDAGRVALGGNELGFSMYSVIVDDGTGYGNSPPELSGATAKPAAVGEEFSFAPTAIDIDGDPIAFGVVDMPTWLTLHSRTGEIFGTPRTSSDLAELAQVVVTADDGEETTDWTPFARSVARTVTRASKGSLSTVLATNAESAPTISGVPPSRALPGTYYTFTAEASDPDGDALKYRISNLPSWAWFNDRTGYLAGKPGSGDLGSFEDIWIRVTDGEYWSELPRFGITVSDEPLPEPPAQNPPQQEPADEEPVDEGPADEEPANESPPATNEPPEQNDDTPSAPPSNGSTLTISANPVTFTRPGDHYGFTAVANDPDGDTLRFRISNMPSWAWFNDRTGFMGGRPQNGHIGTYRGIEISVTDGRNWASLAPFNIVVGTTPPPPSNDPPPAEDPPPSEDPSDDPVDEPKDPPPAEDPPPSEDPSDDPVDEPSDPPPPAEAGAPTITATPVTYTRPGDRYGFTVVASDPDGDRLRFRISNMPSWAWFNDRTGFLGGRPQSRHVGTYRDITISVTDGDHIATLPPFNITVGTAPPPADNDDPDPNDGEDPNDDSPSDPTPSNRAPTISGTPPPSVLQGQSYTFTPTARDADGDRLTFSISNRPSWASFSSSSGRLSGIPGLGDVGTYRDIAIRVTDGTATVPLGTFSIEVVGATTGSAALSWIPPTDRIDGSPLTNLAGYRVYWGPAEGNYPNSVRITNPGVTSYIVENLTPGTWYFAVTAIDSNNLESDHSDAASKTIAAQ